MKRPSSPVFRIVAGTVTLMAAGAFLLAKLRDDDPQTSGDGTGIPAGPNEAATAALAWDDAALDQALNAYLFEPPTHVSADWLQKRRLGGPGSRAHARMLALLADPGHYTQWVTPTGTDKRSATPFHRACELLGDSPPPEVIPLLAPFLDDEDESIRQEAASTLGKTGSPAMVPLLRRALGDPEEYVRKYALAGLRWARESGTLAPETAKALFDDVRQLVEKEDARDVSADVLFALDPARAQEVFLSPGIFHPDSRILHEALETMADGDASVPRERLLQLIEPIQRQKIDYPREYILGEALRLLGRHRHPDDRKLLESFQKHRDEDIAAGASQGILAWHGIEGFEKRVWDREEKVGYASMTRPQQHYSAVFMLDAEINNGGLDQYFVNSSGDQWRDAMEGLKAMKAAKHLAILEKAVARFGKDGPSTDHRTRQEQLAAIARTDEDAFEKLNDRYYDIDDSIEVLASRYALANPEDFR